MQFEINVEQYEQVNTFTVEPTAHDEQMAELLQVRQLTIRKSQVTQADWYRAYWLLTQAVHFVEFVQVVQLLMKVLHGKQAAAERAVPGAHWMQVVELVQVTQDRINELQDWQAPPEAA